MSNWIYTWRRKKVYHNWAANGGYGWNLPFRAYNIYRVRVSLVPALRGSLYGGGGGRKATPGAVKMREKNSIFSMKKQHPKTHTPLYLELLIPLKIMLKIMQKLYIFDSILIYFFCGSRCIFNCSYPSKYCSKIMQKLSKFVKKINIFDEILIHFYAPPGVYWITHTPQQSVKLHCSDLRQKGNFFSLRIAKALCPSLLMRFHFVRKFINWPVQNVA